MNCPLCGHEVSDGVKYCPICGANVEAARIRAQGGDPRSVYYQTQPDTNDYQADVYAQSYASSPDAAVVPDGGAAETPYYDYDEAQQAQEQQAADDAWFYSADPTVSAAPAGAYEPTRVEAGGYGESVGYDDSNLQAAEGLPVEPEEPVEDYDGAGDLYSQAPQAYDNQAEAYEPTQVYQPVTQSYQPATQQYQQTDYQPQPAPYQGNGYQPDAKQADATYAGVRHAVPMQSSAPAGQQSMRDGSLQEREPRPKWPIVLIVILLLVIAVAVALIILQPWNATQPTQSGGDQTPPAQEQTSDSQASAPEQEAVPPEQAQDQGQADEVAQEPPAIDQQPAVDPNVEVFNQLTGYYDALPGYEGRVVDIVNAINNGQGGDDLIATAQQVQTELATQQANLASMGLSADSPYAQTHANISTLYNDLYQRVTTLIAGLTGTDVYSRDNVDGVSRYKSEYESLYPTSRPVQVG